jgi:hypothetical protein
MVGVPRPDSACVEFGTDLPVGVAGAAELHDHLDRAEFVFAPR